MDDTTQFVTSYPPRLHVLLARDSDTAVIFRRGPSSRVATFGWNRRTDEIKLGQWLHGRIYERRSDLSPDGKHLIYFAMNQRKSAPLQGAWTAVSRAPYLKALDFYYKGDCWQGGGLFLSNKSYWLNDGYFSPDKERRAESGLSRDPNYQPKGGSGAECRSVYLPRLLRDGWSEGEKPLYWASSDRIFEKVLPKGWRLRKVCHAQTFAPPGKGCYWDEHELVRADGSETISLPDWEWADWDRDALVWASHGKLYRADVSAAPDFNVAPIHDFAPYKFTAVEAPY